MTVLFPVLQVSGLFHASNTALYCVLIKEVFKSNMQSRVPSYSTVGISCQQVGVGDVDKISVCGSFYECTVLNNNELMFYSSLFFI